MHRLLVSALAVALVGGSVSVSVAAASPARRRSSSAHWSADHRLPRAKYGPSPAINGSGDAVVAWTSTWTATNGQYMSRVWAETKTAAGSWTPGKVLFRTTGVVTGVWSGIGAGGRSVVAWQIGARSYWAQHRPGGAWSAAHLFPHAPGHKQMGISSFSMSRTGYAVVGWQTQGKAWEEVLTPSGTVRRAVGLTRLPSRPVFGAAWVQVHIAADQSVTAAWWWRTVDNPGATYGLWQTRRVAPNGTPASTVTMATHQDPPPTAIFSTSGRSIAMLPSDVYGATTPVIVYRLAGGSTQTHTLADAGRWSEATVAVREHQIIAWWAAFAPDQQTTSVQVSTLNAGKWSTPSRIATYPWNGYSVQRLASASTTTDRLVTWQSPNRVTNKAATLRDSATRTFGFGPKSAPIAVAATSTHAIYIYTNTQHQTLIRTR